jgi:hypothetical protein
LLFHCDSILSGEMIEDTVKIVSAAIKDRIQVDLIINNRAGGNAPPRSPRRSPTGYIFYPKTMIDRFLERQRLLPELLNPKLFPLIQHFKPKLLESSPDLKAFLSVLLGIPLAEIARRFGVFTLANPPVLRRRQIS